MRRRSMIAALMSTAMPALAASPSSEALGRPALKSPVAARSYMTAVAASAKRLWAVGERGIALYSDDGGTRWVQADVPVSTSLTAVQFVDDTHGFAVGHGGVVLGTTDGGVHWTRLLEGTRAAQLVLDDATRRGDATGIQEATRLVAEGPDKPLLDLHFFDRQNGIVVGAYNFVLATEDGGTHWTPIQHRVDNPQGFHWYTVKARGNVVLMAGEQGLVVRSEDRGRTFKRLEVPYKGSFFVSELIDGDRMVVAGLRGNVWRTDDRGARWTQVATRAPVSIVASTQLADGRLLLVNQSGDALVGPLADLKPVQAPLRPVHDVVALTDGRLLAASRSGPIILSPESAK